MDPETNTRISRLEGGSEMLKWSVAAISSVLVGGLAVVVGLQIFALGQVASLETKVDALPSQISSDIQELSRTLSQSITAARSVEMQAPTVIFVPQDPQTSTNGGANQPPR